MYNTRMNKAKQIKDTVLRVNDNTFAIPSQTRTGKAHIVKTEVLIKMVPVPDRLLRRAFYLKKAYNQASTCYPTDKLMGIIKEMDLKGLLEELSKYIDDTPPEITLNCTCEDYQYHQGEKCKHILAVEMRINEGDI